MISTPEEIFEEVEAISEKLNVLHE
jgi:hypothetical protein